MTGRGDKSIHFHFFCWAWRSGEGKDPPGTSTRPRSRLVRSLADKGCCLEVYRGGDDPSRSLRLESPNPRSLEGVDSRSWKRRHLDRYLEAVEKIQARGVTVNGCFVVGLDHDTIESFEDLRDYITAAKLLEVQVTVPTPFPGTPLYHRLNREGRLLQDRFWDRCTLFDVNYRPARMSVAELESGFRWLAGENPAS